MDKRKETHTKREKGFLKITAKNDRKRKKNTKGMNDFKDSEGNIKIN